MDNNYLAATASVRPRSSSPRDEEICLEDAESDVSFSSERISCYDEPSPILGNNGAMDEDIGAATVVYTMAEVHPAPMSLNSVPSKKRRKPGVKKGLPWR